MLELSDSDAEDAACTVSYPCGYCDENFQSEKDMAIHIMKLHANSMQKNVALRRTPDLHKKLESNFNSVFDNQSDDESIATSDSIIESFECHPCKVQFDSERKLTRHFLENHNIKSDKAQHDEIKPKERLYQCKTCPKSFFSSSDLWSHSRIHSGIKYTCELCSKELASSGSLHNHMKSVHEKKDLVCPFCEKNFALKQKYDNHILGHKGGKPFHCKQCDKGFVHKQTYEAHLRRHDGKMLHCSFCSKPFYDAGYLKKHERWHLKVQERKKLSQAIN